MKWYSASWSVVAILCLLAVSAHGQSPDQLAAKDQQNKFFENHIRPLLIENCLKCHGSEKQEGNLRLDSLEAMQEGGDSGPAVSTSQAAESLIVKAVRHDGLEMPPGKRLADEQVDALVRWIDNGASWPASAQAGLELRRGALTDEDRNYWAFRPLSRVSVPAIPDQPEGQRPLNDLDAFIITRQRELGLTMAPEASSHVLVRRLYFDLVGVPPTETELAEYSAQEPGQAYMWLVDRLLGDARYGQRWGRHWLDVVRYAESDGFKQDAYRPAAYLYRDYVIQSLNADKPYDQFVMEQLAADELPDVSSETLAATGFLRHWIYEYNQRDVRSQWSNILNDLTDVTGEAFLGLGIGCARCHDHKFDPILQKDYYRLQASFAAFLPKDETLAGHSEQVADYRARLGQWEEATRDIRQQMAELERGVRERTTEKAIDKFPPDVRPLLRRPDEQREPLEVQLADLANRQIIAEWSGLDFGKLLSGEEKERWLKLKEELASFDHLKPASPLLVMAAGETGSVAPPTFIAGKAQPEAAIAPATLEVLGGQELVAIPPEHGSTTGRRTALANWINDPANPLTHRVIVNRVWQYHFGHGLVANASDFGRLGQPPSHPELLDWLTGWFLEHGRSLKQLHKLIVTSATYRQASRHPAGDQLAELDSDNKYLWHYPARRLDAEQIRDAMLVAAEAMDWTVGGPAADHSAGRRSIYTKVMRNRPDPLLNVLDAPDGNGTVAKRSVTTTPVQSLALANAPWPLKTAREMANSLRSSASSTDQQVKLALVRAYSREPTTEEVSQALRFVDQQVGLAAVAATDSDARADAYSTALADLCHVLFNSSEFLYID